jgi:hypothetical protein
MPYYDLMASIFELPEGEEKTELLQDMESDMNELEHQTGAAEGSASGEE